MEKVSHKKTNIVSFHLYEMYRIGKSIKKENRLMFLKAWWGRRE
jgi:hypothetical protein